MARVNHNANYIYDVDGETVWEKLRSIRGFLQDRRIALQLAELAQEEFNKRTDTDTIEYKKALIMKPQSDANIQDCREEIKFLEEFEAYLTVEAEKTRIPGKTDNEMYEINFYDELNVRLVKMAQAQIIAYGRLSEETAKRVLKNKEALRLCINQGLLGEASLDVANSNILPPAKEYNTNYLENKNG
jgi:hypothetical protein